MIPVFYPDHQQFGIENKDKWENSRPDIITKPLDTCTDGITPRDPGCGKGCKSDRRRIICQNAEVENKQVHGNQGDNQSILGAEADNYRSHQS